MRGIHRIAPPCLIEGVVEHGFGRGSKLLGFATANVSANTSASLSDFLSSEKCVDGVYVGWVSVRSIASPQKAAISVGLNPTFEDSKVRLLEAHLIDYSGPDFYGEDIRIVLCAYIREALKFECVEDLKTEIWEDCEVARQVLEKDQVFASHRNDPFLEFNS